MKKANTMDDIINKHLEADCGEQLKNCPFCGGQASYSIKSASPGAIMFAKCECNDCHALIGVNQTEIAELIKEVCIAKWNRRVACDTTGDSKKD